jgi:hypothetical protein
LVAVEERLEAAAARRGGLFGDADALGPAGEFDELVGVPRLLVGPALDPELAGSGARVRFLEFEDAAEHPVAVALDDDGEPTVGLVEEQGVDAADLS